MRIQEIMSREVKTIAVAATADEARSLMRLHGIHHLVVLDGRSVAGVVSARDLSERAGVRKESRVGELMSRSVVTARPDATLRQAANLLRGHSIGCLVIVEGTKPAGIITTTDLLELLGRGVERPVEHATPWTLRSRGNRRASGTARHERRT